MKTFNTTGYCDPEVNYMVDLSSRLQKVKAMVDEEHKQNSWIFR